MEIIIRQLPKPITPVTGGEEYLNSLKLDQEAIHAVYLWRALPDYKHDVLAQDVLNVLGQLHKLTLKVHQHDGDVIIAKDQKNATYYLVGSWWDSRYVCRGLLRCRKNAKRHCYLTNGQASTGTTEVKHYGEQLQIIYPEIQTILEAFHFAGND